MPTKPADEKPLGSGPDFFLSLPFTDFCDHALRLTSHKRPPEPLPGTRSRAGAVPRYEGTGEAPRATGAAAPGARAGPALPAPNRPQLPMCGETPRCPPCAPADTDYTALRAQRSSAPPSAAPDRPCHPISPGAVRGQPLAPAPTRRCRLHGSIRRQPPPLGAPAADPASSAAPYKHRRLRRGFPLTRHAVARSSLTFK